MKASEKQLMLIKKRKDKILFKQQQVIKATKKRLSFWAAERQHQVVHIHLLMELCTYDFARQITRALQYEEEQQELVVRTNIGLTSQYIRPYCKTGTNDW